MPVPPGNPVLTSESVASILHADPVPWAPPARPIRGVSPPNGWKDVYRQVAPSVVIVATRSGHGSGFFVDDQGTILTNHHVVDSGLSIDAEVGGSYATIFSGSLNADGVVTSDEPSLRAYFLDSDERVDLAVLRVPNPNLVKSLRPVRMASELPPPGDPAAILGHPDEGVFWSIRDCSIAGFGEYPKELVGEVARLLTRSPQSIAAEVETLAPHDIIFTACPAGPGDSGGPLLNVEGEVVGVTELTSQNGNFTYHVRLNEVRDFLAKADQVPKLLTPDPWITGPHPVLLGPSSISSVFQGTNELLLDLDNDSPKKLTRDAFERDPSAVKALVRGRLFDAEMAIHERSDVSRVHYDTDNNGIFDLVLFYEVPRNRLDSAKSAQVAIRLTKDARWELAPRADIPWLDGSPFVEPAIRRKLSKLMKSGFKGS